MKLNFFRLVIGLKWTGRIVGLLIVFFSILVLLFSSKLTWTDYSYIIPFIGITICGLGGIIISWWNTPFASVLLFLSCLGLGIRTFYTHQILMWLIIGLSYLLAGICIFISWKLSKLDK